MFPSHFNSDRELWLPGALVRKAGWEIFVQSALAGRVDSVSAHIHVSTYLEMFAAVYGQNGEYKGRKKMVFLFEKRSSMVKKKNSYCITN